MKALTSVTPTLLLGFRLPHRPSAVPHARETDFEPSVRRLFWYPNRSLAKSASPLDRRHPRRRHLGNPSTDHAHFVIDDIQHWQDLQRTGPL